MDFPAILRSASRKTKIKNGEIFQPTVHTIGVKDSALAFCV